MSVYSFSDVSKVERVRSQVRTNGRRDVPNDGVRRGNILEPFTQIGSTIRVIRVQYSQPFQRSLRASQVDQDLRGFIQRARPLNRADNALFYLDNRLDLHKPANPGNKRID